MISLCSLEKIRLLFNCLCYKTTNSFSFLFWVYDLPRFLASLFPLSLLLSFSISPCFPLLAFLFYKIFTYIGFAIRCCAFLLFFLWFRSHYPHHLIHSSLILTKTSCTKLEITFIVVSFILRRTGSHIIILCCFPPTVRYYYPPHTYPLSHRFLWS